MKRGPELRDLFEDHHHGLVLVQKAKKAGARGDERVTCETWVEVETAFERELAPHFAIEESQIAPGLSAAGESGLIRRLFDEHWELREPARPGAGRSAEDLLRFGELLEAHIRFEERELFEAAERLLSPDELQSVSDACRRRHS